MRIISFSDNENIEAVVVVIISWRRGVVVITTAQLHSTSLDSGSAQFKPCSRRVGDSRWRDLRQWSRLEIRLNAFRQSTISQKKNNSERQKTPKKQR